MGLQRVGHNWATFTFTCQSTKLGADLSQHARPPCLSFTISRSLLKLTSIESISSNHLIPYHPLLLLPSIFPSINLSQWVRSSHEVAKGLSRVFSNTTVVKYQFSGSQPCLWSNSHIHTWLLEIPQLLLYGPLDMAACSQLKLRTLLHVGLWSTLFIVHLYNWYADIIWLQNVSCSNKGLIFLAYQDRWWEKNS